MQNFTFLVDNFFLLTNHLLIFFLRQEKKMKNFFKSLRLSFLKGSKLSEEKALELLLEALLKKEHEEKNKD